MMKKMMFAAMAAAALCAFTACSSIETATTLNNQKLTATDSGTSVAHMNAEIWGIYLFNLPLFSGSSKQPGRCAVFTDTVTVDRAVSMLTAKAAESQDSTAVVNLTSNRKSNLLIFFLPLLWKREVQASGNVIRY